MIHLTRAIPERIRGGLRRCAIHIDVYFTLLYLGYFVIGEINFFLYHKTRSVNSLRIFNSFGVNPRQDISCHSVRFFTEGRFLDSVIYWLSRSLRPIGIVDIGSLLRSSPKPIIRIRSCTRYQQMELFT